MPPRASAQKRQSVNAACLAMNALGINQGTSGNISVRDGEGLLITPTSMPYDMMKPGDIVEMRLDAASSAADARQANGVFISTFCARDPTSARSFTPIPPIARRWPSWGGAFRRSIT